MSIITNNRESRVMIFIDLRNIVSSVAMTQSFPFKTDFYSLARLLAGQRNVLAAYVFDGTMGDDEDSTARTRKFHDYLRYNGFRVVERNSVEGREQKEVDVAMACEMVVHALKDNYDVAIVISGDRDFVPAIQHVQSAGKIVEVAAFRTSASEELRRTADKYIELESLPILTMFNKVEDVTRIIITDEEETSE